MRSTLLKPFRCSLRHRFLPDNTVPLRTVVALVLAVIVTIALYKISFRVLSYFHSQNELGIILSLKIFQMAWITVFAMLIFSCMVSAVSTLFLSQDNEILFASPAPPADLYFMRYVTTSIYTSWMMVIFSIPVFAAYGEVFNAGWAYWPLLTATILATAAIASGFGMAVTVVLVNIFPARRTKDIVLYLSLCFGIFIYIMFRLMRPEDLVNPEKYGHFIEYLSSISTPAGPYVPGAWAANFLSGYLLDRQVDWLLLALLLITPLALYILGEMAMEFWFFSGFSKSQESFGGYRRFRPGKKYSQNRLAWIFRKEAKLFLRDSAEWSQIFMIAALVIVYLYNFKALPVERSPFQEEYVTNIISFLNIGLTGFIMASLSVRFVYPSVGAEGGSFYILHSAPLSLNRFLFYKYLFYVIPFMALTMILLVVSNKMLNIEGPMWWISIISGSLITLTVVALALGFGSMYADFKSENRTAALGNMGAILFLFTAISFELTIIFMGGKPAYRLVRAWLKGTELHGHDMQILAAWSIGSILLALSLTLFFWKKGVRRLEERG